MAIEKEVWEKGLGIIGNKNMKGKKAQLAIFVIIGVVLAAGILAYFSYRFENSNAIIYADKNNPNVKPVYNFITDCVKSVGNDAIYQIGKTGGYAVPPNPFLLIDNETYDSVAYYLYDGGIDQSQEDYDLGDAATAVPGAPSPALASEEPTGKQNYMPSKERIESELGLYIDNFIYYCLNDYRNFPNFNVTQGDAKTTAKIEDGKVVFSVSYPLKIEKNGKTYSVKDFENTVPVRLDKIYSLTAELMENQMEKTDAVCMNCIHDIALKYDMKIKMMDSSDGIVFAVLDEKSKINNREYIFYFANKYD